MKVVIVDDEALARSNLRELFDEIPDVEVVGEATNGAAAVELISAMKPDVAFLDLQMPELDGFGVVRELRGAASPLVVYVTAYSERALDAFDAGAVDYLLKPVRVERMEAALERVRKQLAVQAEAPPAAGRMERLVGRLGEDLYLFRAEEVIAFQADGDVTYLLTARNRYYSDRTLKELEERLPAPPFARVHRKTIVNTDHIRRISPLSSKRWLLRMSNGFEAVVSRRMKAALRVVEG